MTEHDNRTDRGRLNLNRRGLLKCMAWTGTGTVWSVAGGVPRGLGLGEALAAPAAGGFTFVQISDSHIGFNKEANPDTNGTLQAAIDRISQLPTPPAMVLHTGDVTHLSKPEEFDTAAQILNVVVLTAALSVYNSCVYCNSRMLFGLAEQGDAPKPLMKLNKRGVPLRALGVSALMTMLSVLVNYVAPHEALELLFALVVASLMINWAMISLTHLKFRKAMGQRGIVPGFKAFWSPYTNYLCLAFMAMIIYVMLMIPGVRASVYAIPVWVLILFVFYRIRLAKTRSLSVAH